MNALALVEDTPMSSGPLTSTGTLYSEDDFRAVGEYIIQHDGEPMEQVYLGVADYLSERQNRDVTPAAAKNMVNRGRQMGLIPLSPRQVTRRSNKAAKAKASKAPKPPTEPKAPKVKEFKHGLTTDDFMDFVVQMVYCDDSNMPTRHFAPLMEFRGHVATLLEALK